MSDPLIKQDPNAPQILGSKDYGSGVSTQDVFIKPQYQQPQQPINQVAQPLNQYQAPQFRQAAQGANSSVSRLMNFARANVGAGTQRMQQGIQQGLQRQSEMDQNRVQQLGAGDMQKGLGIAQNQGTLLNSLNSQAGYKNLVQGTLGTQNPNRAGLENFLLKSTPGAMSNIQNTARQGFQNTLGNLNQYMGGFKTNIQENGNTTEQLNKYDNLTDNDLNVQDSRSEEEIARGMGLVNVNGEWFNPEDVDTNYENDEEPQAAKISKAKAAELITRNVSKKVEQKATAAVQKVKSKAEESARKIFSGFKKWCHAFNTQVFMSDGSLRSIQNLEIGDEMMEGGKVLYIQPEFAYDMYLYNLTEVSGNHAVLEDGKWIRVKDSKKSQFVGNRSLVFPIINENHVIITADKTVWRDFKELDNSNMLTDEEIISILNEGK